MKLNCKQHKSFTRFEMTGPHLPHRGYSKHIYKGDPPTES